MATFSHVGLVVSDLEKSVAFYEQALGLTCLQRFPDTGRGVAIAFMGNEQPALELLHYLDTGGRQVPKGGCYEHFAWIVQDIDSSLERLAALGIEPEKPVQSVLDGRRIAFFRGPDRERIELVELPK